MKFKRKSRENWSNWSIPQECIAQIRKEFRYSRRKYGIAFLVLVIAVSYGFWDASESRKVSCLRQNETRSVLVSVIDRLVSDQRDLYMTGQIGVHEYEHEIATFIFAKSELAPRNCKRELFATGI